MTTAHCPRCCEQVTVPGNASREATVQCPLCREEYSLAEALDQLPPSLIVLSDFGDTPSADVEEEEDSQWGALNLDEDADDIALAPMGDASPAAAFDFASGSATTGSKSKAAIRPSSRARKPKGSPIKSVLSIVIGGLMAFPIAQLILWHLPGDWKRDFGAGPIVAQYVPMIVPEKFRGSQANSNSEPGTQDSDSVIPDFSFGGGEFAQTSNVGQGNANTNNQKTNNPKKKQNTNNTATFGEEPLAEEQMSTEDAAAAGADVFGSPLEVPGLELGGLPLLDAPVSPTELPNVPAETTEASVSPPPPDDAPLPTEVPESDVPEPAVSEPAVSGLAPGNIRNAPQVSADKVVKSVQAATNGNLAWDNDEASSPSKAIMREFYSGFSKLGEALTFADPSDENVAAQIVEARKLLQEVGKQSVKLDVIRGAAKSWMAAGHEVRKTNGICLTGVVKSVEPIGKLFETTVDSEGQQIAVVSMSDPSEHFAVDRQVLILGTILDDPAKNLGGYEGSSAVVVLDGYHVNVAAE